MVVPRLITVTVITQLLLLTCVHLSVSAETSSTVDDLMDFDFENNVKSESKDSQPVKSESFDPAFEDFLDIIDAPNEDGSSHLEQKEKHVKNKLARAWSNPNMQRKFAEVLPILKVMTGEQKIALAALVSAQVGAKQGRELNLDQVSERYRDCLSDRTLNTFFTGLLQLTTTLLYGRTTIHDIPLNFFAKAYSQLLDTQFSF